MKIKLNIRRRSGIIFTFVWIHVLLLSSIDVYSQNKYWIEFTDKGDISHYSPEDILSPRALANRQRKGIKLDVHDYPVNAEYIQALNLIGVQPLLKSKWINGVSAYLHPTQITLIAEQPFVRTLTSVGATQITDKERVIDSCDNIPFRGSYLQQLNMLGIDTLHAEGFTGKGTLIAVFDNGFYGVDQAEGFQHMFENNRIIATKDYVEGDDDVFGICAGCRHGTNVLSTLTAIVPNQIQGAAPDAEYILLRTENDSSETHQEEDNWMAAAEFADSLGAQIFSTSLGYLDGFTIPGQGYTPADMDGNTAIITRAADIAASRGIIVVNSAGNSRDQGIVAPADGDSVIAVGAVNNCEEVASFSSRGFRIDGVVKPDVSALGQSVVIYRGNGTISTTNGTSFSCPLISGLIACIVQAHPEATRQQVYDALIQSADRFNTPDPDYGYGIPSASRMQQILGETLLSEIPSISNTSRFSLFPNPSSGTFSLTSFHPIPIQELTLSIVSINGQSLYSIPLNNLSNSSTWEISLNLPDGLYFYHVYALKSQNIIAQGKLVINSTFEP